MADRQPDEKELVSFRLPKLLKKKLAALSDATGRSQTFLAEEALESFCHLHAWQVAALQEGIQAADEGRLIPHEQVKRVWEQKLENLVD